LLQLLFGALAVIDVNIDSAPADKIALRIVDPAVPNYTFYLEGPPGTSAHHAPLREIRSSRESFDRAGLYVLLI
jgi:hypothetical protein